MTFTGYSILIILGALLLTPLNSAVMAAQASSLDLQKTKIQQYLNKKKAALYCPEPHALIKAPSPHNVWYAYGGWLSYDVSFSTHIQAFIGAQWQGVNVGHIICLYLASEDLTFPIQLSYNQLVLEPNTHRWGANQGGYRNCASHDVTQCPFMPYQHASQGDMYQQVKHLRNSTDGNENEQAF